MSFVADIAPILGIVGVTVFILVIFWEIKKVFEEGGRDL